MDSLTDMIDLGQVVDPASVDMEKCNLPFHISQNVLAYSSAQLQKALGCVLSQQRCGRPILQDISALLMNNLALLLDNGRIVPQRSANLEVLAFDNALRPCDFVPYHGIVNRLILPRKLVLRRDELFNAVPPQQVVLQADKESR